LKRHTRPSSARYNDDARTDNSRDLTHAGTGFGLSFSGSVGFSGSSQRVSQSAPRQAEKNRDVVRQVQVTQAEMQKRAGPGRLPILHRA
jgi:hypothetical protein